MGAPTPGQAGAGGIYGPDDGYHVNAALYTQAAVVVVTGLGIALGAMLV